jgi:hypothetical protein
MMIRALSAAASAAVALAINNGKGVTPPMGWCVVRAEGASALVRARAGERERVREKACARKLERTARALVLMRLRACPCDDHQACASLTRGRPLRAGGRGISLVETSTRA